MQIQLSVKSNSPDITFYCTPTLGAREHPCHEYFTVKEVGQSWRDVCEQHLPAGIWETVMMYAYYMNERWSVEYYYDSWAVHPDQYGFIMQKI